MSITTRLQCRHILASGLRCGSPALKAEAFCYYHHTTRRPIPRTELHERRSHQSTFTLPALEDRTAIQLALGEVLARIASHDIDTKRAGLLLYGLQIALSSLPRQIIPERTPEPIDELIHDETHGPLAPIAEFQRASRDKSLEEILLEQWKRDGEEELARRAAKENAHTENKINLQAVTAAEVTPPQSTPCSLFSSASSVVRFSLKSPANFHPLKTLPQIKGAHPYFTYAFRAFPSAEKSFATGSSGKAFRPCTTLSALIIAPASVV
jgi:hypothetical protein